MQKLKRAGMFTDIHFGRKNNSKIHNEDCKSFTLWFKDQCVKYDVDHIVFLGDWFEERTAIDSLTSKYAMDCASILNDVGIPIYFIVGNHDLYYRDNREVFASYIYKSLENFVLVDEPLISEDTIVPTLYSPFLFEHEYADLSGYFDVPIWMGHFEFKGFVLTGDTVVKESGPDPDKFSAPDKIFSGHFHKRQHSKNISYIGNAFPMDFGDANDNDRGMAIYDYESGDTQYINWEDCPKYMRVKLSEINENPDILSDNARVKCVADVDITFSENSELKQKMITDHQLREFTIEEVMTVTVVDSELTEEDVQNESTNALVRKMLKNIESDKIENDLLISEYDKL
jgi:DNA repair exonuclease SbcCD nuclease subunit